jgi:hypothetical protein
MKNLYFTLLSLLIVALLVAGCNNSGTEKANQTTAQEEPTEQQLAERGEYLVRFAGCHDCHSPKDEKFQEINELLLSGYPSTRPIMQGDPRVLKQGWVLFVPDLTSASGPWGVSFSANLTSDPTGIGNWTEENFLRALKEGKYKGLANSRTLLPPMPWQNFSNAKDEDLRAIFAYLKSTPPVNNIVPAAIITDQKPASQASPTTRQGQ